MLAVSTIFRIIFQAIFVFEEDRENLKFLKLVVRPAYFTHTCLVSTSNNCEASLKQNDGVDCMHCRNSAFAVSFGL